MQRPFNNILIISTGGTFNKVYNPINGSLEVDSTGNAIRIILSKWLCYFKIVTIIDKDSLDINDIDRGKLLDIIRDSSYSSIIVIHGTDTIDISTSFIADAKLSKRVVFTGAMIPFAIDSVEATANLALALGFLQASKDSGVYIAINGVVGSYRDIIKDRVNGKFVDRKFL